MTCTCPSASKMVLRGAIGVSLLICFTSASPTRELGEPIPGQTKDVPQNPLQQFPEAPLQSKEVIPDPVKSDVSQNVVSPQNLQSDTKSDLSRLPVAPSEANTLDVNGNEAGIQMPADDLATDQEFSNEFVKKVLRGFFDELKKRPDLVEQILRYETLKELTRPRSDAMFLPSDVITANLQELQPVEEAQKLDTLTQGETLGQTQQAQAQQAGQTDAQTQPILSQPSQVANEVASKRDNSGGNSTGTGSQDQAADGKAQMETPKSKGDNANALPAAPLQDPFYYYFYYPDDEMPTETDTFVDSSALNNGNSGATPSPEDAVIEKLAKSVLAVIQYGLESNNNDNNNNIINNNNGNASTNKNDNGVSKGDNAQMPSVNQEENQDIKGEITNGAQAGSSDVINEEEDQLSRLAGTSEN